MQKFISVILVIALFLNACKNDKNANEHSSLNKIKYEFLHDESGTVVKDGDYVDYAVVLMAGDSILYQSSEKEISVYQMKKEKILDSINIYNEIFHYLSEGDSVKVHLPQINLVTSLLKLPYHPDVKMYLGLQNITSALEYAELQKKKEMTKAENAKLAEGKLNEIKQTVKEAAILWFGGKGVNGENSTKSGIKISIIQDGSGPLVQKGQLVSVDYCGVLKDGSVFNQSYSKLYPLKYYVGSGTVIPGWEEIIPTMKVGTKALVYIPARLAYGEYGFRPNVPANADLVFYMEILSAE